MKLTTKEDNMKTCRANATEINKSPAEIRYVFITRPRTISRIRGETVKLTTTYRTLSDNMAQGIEELKVADLKHNLVIELRLDLLPSFLDEWRENYFDPDWSIPFQFTK